MVSYYSNNSIFNHKVLRFFLRLFVFVLHEQNIYLLTHWFQVSIFWTFSPFFLQKEGVPLNEFDFTQKNFFFDFFMLRQLETFFQGEKKKFLEFWKNLVSLTAKIKAVPPPGGFYSFWNRWVKKRMKTIRANILEQSETYEYKTVATRWSNCLDERKRLRISLYQFNKLLKRRIIIYL